MTPILLDLPASRTLPPTVAYAAGLVCELRPDLADGARSAVLGDDAAADLHRLTLACGALGDGQGNAACDCLRLLVEHHDTHITRSYLHALADILNVIPQRTAEMQVTTGDGEGRDGDPTIGDVYATGERVPMRFYPSGTEVYRICGLTGAQMVKAYNARDAANLLDQYLRRGFDAAWADVPRLAVGAREALRRLIPLHAHTISLDAEVRAAWAKTHLDALGAA
jgi:hypothetical protein